MNFLRNLFSGSNPNHADRDGLYIYVQPKRCDEVLRIRINLMNDLSLADDGSYFVRKMVSATRCPFQAEVELYFDRAKSLVRSDVTNGEMVDEDAYHTWLDSQQG